MEVKEVLILFLVLFNYTESYSNQNLPYQNEYKPLVTPNKPPYGNPNPIDNGFMPLFTPASAPQYGNPNIPPVNNGYKPQIPPNQNHPSPPSYGNQILPQVPQNDAYRPPVPPVQPAPTAHPHQDYQYTLPLRKVTSCPSFASFKFACQSNHLLSIESVVFSQVFVDERGECVADWKAECRDDSEAFDYAVKQCAGQESCNLYSYNLRSRTKCNYHQVISVFYRCVPTFEVVDVPIKCDICKNVTVNRPNDNYGFIHSSWYPKLYPRETCHSLIQNKPDHFIIIYSVSGFIGLDRIEIESVNQYGALVIKETLTGNITTQLVLTSAFNVNITVLTSDTYYQNHRHFLLYFFIVPKCTVVLCSNVTGLPPSITHLTPVIYPNATVNHSTFAPPLIADSNHGHKKISDAWLAAILALAYAMLMVFAVLLAIYCRRRRRRRYADSNIIFSPSAISQSQIINPLSRAASQISLKNEINLPMPGYMTNTLDQSGFYSHVRENYNFQHDENIPKIRQYDEDYSQVITNEEDNFSVHASTFMNYGDMDVQETRQSSDLAYHGTVIPGSIDLNSVSYPFSMKTNTQHGAILASGAANETKNMYRAVEFSKGPSCERMCVRNLDDSVAFDSSQMEDVYRTYDSSTTKQTFTETSYRTDEVKRDEKTYVVKLYPVDDKEVQEMTMYVDNRH
ncbi:unnamed protein product [Brachionus calyciflorus]|uniref:SUEL-type lectin domain-containing protein n=1 Tax=Brachionus calyciflorus TaxID=104777 RepID=A0A813Q8K1_9BILA|nr:unnamed protein product [Brachionus calyciflorus]